MLKFYRSETIGNKKNCLYTKFVEVNDTQSLKEAVKGDYVCAEYKDNHRSKDNFISSNCLAVDFDNDFSEDPNSWITPEKLKEKFKDVTIGIHFSRNHNKDKVYKDEKTGEVTKTVTKRPRFHAFFEINEIKNLDEYSDIKKLFYCVYPFCDDNALDGARFFFGTENPEVDFIKGTRTLNEFLEEDDIDKKDDVIKDGTRNSTLSKFAAVVLMRFGNTEQAYSLFLKKAE